MPRECHGHGAEAIPPHDGSRVVRHNLAWACATAPASSAPVLARVASATNRLRSRDDEHTLAQEWEHALLVIRALPLQRHPETATVIRTGDDSVSEVQGTAQQPTAWLRSIAA